MLAQIFFLFFLVGFLAPAVAGATVYGEVYDSDSLGLAKNILVQINTRPVQKIFSKTGNYSFEAGPGNYVIRVLALDGVVLAEENISIAGEGRFEHDILLFLSPDFWEDLIEEPTVEEVSLPENSFPAVYLLAAAFIVATTLAIAYLALKKTGRKPSKPVKPVKKHEKREKKVQTQFQAPLFLTREARELFEKIRAAGGVTTQKDLRREMPFSEGKVSLLITELEDAGLVKRIKRGRANVVKLAVGGRVV